MSPKTYLRILQGGIIVSLLAILCVFRDLLFPYITSKQLPFNILMEILFAIWLVFILRYPEYRPKKNFISYGLIAYFLAILASCVISIDFNLSFWGDAERMLGFFHLAHFLIFYFILITAFRTWKEWRALFLLSVAIATLVSLIGLFGQDGYSTIGNTAYVSGYLIFSIYFIILLFFRSTNKSARWLYVLPLIFMFWEFKNMRTSGAIIGLGVSILILFLLVGLSHVNKKIRRTSLVVFILAIIALAGIFSQTSSAWFQNSFLKNLTSQKTTFQTRLISWRGAAADFKNHPIFGTGFGNYAAIFDKHFDSKFYNYTIGDTYFDRAHNNLIDITSTTGVLGLLTYLSIFLAAAYYLFKEFKLNGKLISSEPSGLNNIEIIIIVSLISAYFIQNLAIFDSFSTFIGLMIILGFIYWLNFRRPIEGEEEREPRFVIKKDSTEVICLIVFLIIAYIFANYYNVKNWKMFTGSIKGYSLIASGQLIPGVEAYQKSLTGRPLERDARVILLNIIVSNTSLLNSVSSQEAQEIIDYTISLAEINASYNPGDSMMQMQLAQILDAAARYNYKNLEKFNFYSRQAMAAIDASIDASPGRATIYFIKAQMQLVRMENEEAVATMKYGIALNPNYFEGYCRLAQVYFVLNDDKYADELGSALDNCIDRGGSEQLGSANLLKQAINYYTGKKDFNHAAILAERLAIISDADPEVWYNLAKIYFVIGNNEKAEESFQIALRLEPSLISEWDVFKKAIGETRKVTK